MGASVSFIAAEQKTWLEHIVKFNNQHRKVAVNLLSNFNIGEEIEICYVDRTFQNFPYRHYFIRSGVWILEFDGDDIYSAQVNVHCNRKVSFSVESKHEIVPAMKERMAHVVGMSNYSLCLRNCEHIARYVVLGRWFSTQMNQESGTILRAFKSYILADTLKLVNCLPYTLREHKQEGESPEVYTAEIFATTGFAPYKFSRIDYYLDENENTYNVLVIGPTGSGKSRLINVIFNKQIADSRASLESVTREVSFIRGQAKIGGQERPVVLVDTVGFCDSEIKDDNEIFRLIQNRVESNMLKIDVVLFVLPQRLEAQHKTTIKKFLNWLQYDRYPENFMFIIGKCDGLDAKDQKNLTEQCAKVFDLKKTSFTTSAGRTVEQLITAGFPQIIEGPVYKAQVVSSFEKITHALFIPPENPIAINTKKCIIL